MGGSHNGMQMPWIRAFLGGIRLKSEAFLNGLASGVIEGAGVNINRIGKNEGEEDGHLYSHV